MSAEPSLPTKRLILSQPSANLSLDCAKDIRTIPSPPAPKYLASRSETPSSSSSRSAKTLEVMVGLSAGLALGLELDLGGEARPCHICE